MGRGGEGIGSQGGLTRTCSFAAMTGGANAMTQCRVNLDAIRRPRTIGTHRKMINACPSRRGARACPLRRRRAPLLGETQPRLREREPEGLVALVHCRLRHPQAVFRVVAVMLLGLMSYAP